MPVDVGDENVRVRVKDPDSFVQDSFRTITISEELGIKAVIGKLKSDPEGSTTVQSYIFDKSKWNPAEAEKWVKEHKRGRQRRYIQFAEGEIRSAYDKTNGHSVTGYGAVFNERTRLYEDFWEQVAPGAFTESLKRDNVYSLWQHDWSQPLGDLKSGTLRLWEDDKGLIYEVYPGETTYGMDVVKNAKRGVVRQSSFGFDIVKEHRTVDYKAKQVTRTIESVRLYDVGPVTLAAYPQTEGLNVRMARQDRSVFYLEGDDVVEIEEEESEQKPIIRQLSDEELFNEFEALKKTAL